MAAMRKLNLHVRKWYKDGGGVWARLRCRTVYSIGFFVFFDHHLGKSPVLKGPHDARRLLLFENLSSPKTQYA